MRKSEQLLVNRLCQTNEILARLLSEAHSRLLLGPEQHATQLQVEAQRDVQIAGARVQEQIWKAQNRPDDPEMPDFTATIGRDEEEIA